LATLFQEATIEHLADVINRKTLPVTWSSLINIEPQGDHPPFFCVHGITGDILWFRDLARELAPNYPFYGLQSRGLDGIQSPLTRIEEMAAHYIQDIRLLQPTGPYNLGGASFGAVVALEMAQQLRAQGEQISMLAIFDDSPLNIQVDSEDGKLKRYLINGHKIARNFPHWFKDFIQLGPSRIFMRIRRKLRLIRKTIGQTDPAKPGSVDAQDLIDFASELSPHQQRVITCNLQAVKMYIPQPYPGQVTLFRATSRQLLDIDDPEATWQKLAPGRVHIHDIPGSHEGMFKKPHVHYLAEKLKSCINKSLRAFIACLFYSLDMADCLVTYSSI
jgi:thioesterase domain-containing protein